MKWLMTPALMAKFLIEHPECHDDFMKAEVEGQVEDMISFDGVLKLTAFLAKEGVISKKKAREFREAIEKTNRRMDNAN